MALPLVIGGGAAVAGLVYEAGKHFGLWAKKVAPRKMPPPGVISDGHPIMTGDPAIDMNSMLKWTGYRLIDQPIYKLFQQSVSLKADGYPGQHTMAALTAALQAKGVAQQNVANVPVYPWLGPPHGYDGVNAPTLGEWLRGVALSHPAAKNVGAPDAGEAGGMPLSAGSTNVNVKGVSAVPTDPASLAAAAASGVLKAEQTGVISAIEATAKAAETAVGA